MGKIYQKNIAVFLIVLVATIPFYVSSVFAQGNVQDPVASCLTKKQDSDEIVETLDSGPIKVLEGIASTLHFTCTAWYTVEASVRAFHVSTGFCTDFTCKVDPTCTGPGGAVCASNDGTATARDSIATVFESLCNKVECGENFIADSLGLETISGLQTELGGIGVGPFDNIYTSIAYLCPVGILFNLRKLKTIYQVHSCCIEQACNNGVSTESCERQLSEATCMYWEGSILQSLVGIMIHFISIFFAKALEDKVQALIAEAGIGRFLAAVKALFSAYNHIQSLIKAFEWMSETFSEPNCEDLNFGQIREQARQASRINCELVQVDVNDDGIIDRIEQRCA